jgi:hypothetical protein
MPAIAKGHAANLKTLTRAFRNGDVALVDCRDKATGKPVVVLAMIGRDGDEYIITPVAKMFDGNPYDELDPPNPDSPDGYGS